MPDARDGKITELHDDYGKVPIRALESIGSPGAASYLVRVNPVPWRGISRGEFVLSGNANTATVESSQVT